MFNSILNMLRQLFGSEPINDPRKEYRFRCTACYEVSGEKINSPMTEEQRVVMITCAKCGTDNRLTIPFVPEEKPDDAAPR